MYFYKIASFMKLILLWVYTILIAGVWWFFIVAKMHAYKFKNFSNYIVPFTNALLIALGILTVAWYALIFNSSESNIWGWPSYSNNSSSSSSSTNY